MLFLSKFKATGHSMEPLIKNGEKIIVSSIPYLFESPKINDIVVVRLKDDLILIKRIIKIVNGKYFLLGDNKKDSMDSRSFGNLSRKQILGKMIYKL